MFLTNKPNSIVIGDITLKDIKEKNYLTLKLPLSNIDISNLKYVKPGTTLNLRFTNGLVTAEGEYLLNVIEVINELAKYPNNYNVVINITNRELLRQSKLISKLPGNVNLEINTDDYLYYLNQYKKEEEKIEKIVSQIRNANLSPLERYLAIYEIVKKFKQYNKNEKDRRKDRELRYILADDNPYIVCSGFSNLLNELCKRVNIHTKYINVSFDKTDKISPLPLEIDYTLHARNIVKIDDDKYNVHGYYIADSTWDNHPNWDLYLNCLLTFDRKKEARHLESLEDTDLLLDFHNIEDFSDKIKYFIKKHSTYEKFNQDAGVESRHKAYKDLYNEIMKILFELDKPTYKEFYDKYHEYFIFDKDNISSIKIENIISSFLVDYAKYIIPLSNNAIDIKVVIRALINVKKNVYKWDDETIKEWLNKIIMDNAEAEKEAFPYIYDPNNKTEAFLEERNIKK